MVDQRPKTPHASNDQWAGIILTFPIGTVCAALLSINPSHSLRLQLAALVPVLLDLLRAKGTPSDHI